ncbi:MAG: GFA family protein [Planctomycetota bacterium]
MSDTDSPEVTGTCLCGDVHFRIRGELLGFQYCHCSRCRRFTGSAHAANCFVPPDGVEWLRGENGVGRFQLDAEPGFPTSFCQRCGSSLPSLSSTGKYWVVPAGTLNEDPGLRPARSIFWDSRAEWFVPTGELPTHPELPHRDSCDNR